MKQFAHTAELVTILDRETLAEVEAAISAFREQQMTGGRHASQVWRAPGVEPRSLFADRLTFRSYERIVGASFSLKGLRTVNRSSTI
jgi:hypothetical protein